ncbi:MAG: sensor histidine kinase [Bacteroidota bacterium]
MKQSTFRRYGLLSQIALFVIFFLINFVENYASGMFLEAFIGASNYTFMVVAVTVLHYFYVLPLYLKGRRLLYVVSLMLLMTVFIASNYLIFAVLLYYAGEGSILEWIGPTDVAYDYLVLMITTAFTSLYYFVELWFKNISKEAQLRNEKLQAELNFLKSQINPHFLFNTLNNIYSFAQTGNEKTAPMLERLSSILRFMVYDCEENRVGLSKEITAVQDLLEIHKMKNSEQRNIELNVEGVKGFHLIAPLIIVNFVENACKHSNAVSDPNGFIKISITVDESDHCLLEVINSFKMKSNADSRYGGIGMENIKKRLALQYDTNYTLNEEKSDGVYHLKLAIPLERKK